MQWGDWYLQVAGRAATFLWLFGVPLTAWAQSTPPVIVSATVSGGQIAVTGQNFMPGFSEPIATLDNVPLPLVSVTNQTLVATMPTNLGPGSYLLIVTNSSSQSNSFTVNVGAVGPTGPAGPGHGRGGTGGAADGGCDGTARRSGTYGAPWAGGGPAGAAGPAGPVGPQGATGAAGPQGPAGPAGPQGATGAVGPHGPAGPTGAVGPAGPQGATGAAGPQGPAGPASSGSGRSAGRLERGDLKEFQPQSRGGCAAGVGICG